MIITTKGREKKRKKERKKARERERMREGMNGKFSQDSLPDKSLSITKYIDILLGITRF